MNMKKLFYMLVLIGLVGCGKNKPAIPDNLRVYESVYDQEYHFDGAYGAREIKPFGGMFGIIKQVISPLANGGEKKILYHRNGLIDEIATSSFDESTRQNLVDEVKYLYKYSDDVLLRTVLKNGSSVYEDKTYYRNRLPMLRESRAGTEKWGYDNEGRMTTYHRNDTLMLEKSYMLDTSYEEKWIEEYRYNPDNGRYSKAVTNFNDVGQIIEIKYYESGEYLYSEEYEYNDDGSYEFYSSGEFGYWHIRHDKFGNFAGDRSMELKFEYDSLGNWIKKIEDSWMSAELHDTEIRQITYWE